MVYVVPPSFAYQHTSVIHELSKYKGGIARKFIEVFEAIVADDLPGIDSAGDDLHKFSEDGSVFDIKHFVPPNYSI
jgi:hypothetical protein